MDNKKNFLDLYSHTYNPDESFEDFDAVFKKYHVEKIYNNLIGGKVLELGCASGYSTKLLDNFGLDITVVEGSKNYIDLAKKKYVFKNVNFIHSLWEEFNSDHRFSDILLVDSLQLVEKRKDLLIKISNLLIDGGRLHLIVPNNHSFHRILGKEMNLIKNLDSKSERDTQVKAKQDMNWSVVKALVSESNLQIVHEEGILFKLFDNKQMINLEQNIIDALFSLGNKFKKNAAHIYVCCEKL